MMTDRELMQQWLQPGAIVPVDTKTVRILLDALRERLAQPERIQLTVRDFVVTVGDIEDAVGTPMYWAEWPNKEQP